MKLFESELRILDLLWESGDTPAAEIAKHANEKYGWSVTTTYTIIKKCIDKRIIERRNPKFICHPLISRQQVQEFETTELLQRFFDGKADCLISTLAQQHSFTEEEIKNLQKIIEDFTP